MVANTGSTARDFLATERNFLAQCRLGIVFSVLSSSFLLQARVASVRDDEPGRVPFGNLYFVVAICILFLGLGHYFVISGRLIARRVLFRVTALQTSIMAISTCLVITTCIVLLADGEERRPQRNLQV